MEQVRSGQRRRPHAAGRVEHRADGPAFARRGHGGNKDQAGVLQRDRRTGNSGRSGDVACRAIAVASGAATIRAAANVSAITTSQYI